MSRRQVWVTALSFEMKNIGLILSRIGLAVTLFICGCDLPTEPGPQPTIIIETEFIPGHNILGILRMDEIPGSSFIRVERAYKTTEITEDFSAVIDNALVTVSWMDTSAVFEYSPDDEVYLNENFVPQIGIEYSLSILSESLPTLTAKTSILEDMADEPSVSINNNQISVLITPSPSIELYDVYLVSDFDRIYHRISGDSNQLELSIDLGGLNGNPKTVEIYGYDANLSEYLQTSITIKPQSYHETVTTVENGYGCFGAVKVIEVDL